MRSKRLLICGCIYGAGNFGDEAILGGLVRILRRAMPEAEIRVITMNPPYARNAFGIDAFEYTPAATRKAFRWATHICLGGGTMVEDLDSPGYPVGYISQCIRLARAMGKPVCFVGIGGGDLSDAGKKQVGLYYSKARLVTVRNNGTRDVLVASGLPPETICVTADPAYVFIDEVAPSPQDPKPQFTGIGLTNESFPKRIGNAYKKSVAEAAGLFYADHPDPVIFFGSEIRPEEFHDYPANLDAAALLPPGVNHTVEQGTFITPLEFMRQLRRYKLIVTMRMHVVMFAAMLRVPVVTVLRSRKMAFAVGELGYKKHVLVSDFTGRELYELMAEAAADPREYLADPAAMAALKERAFRIGPLVREWSDGAGDAIGLGERMTFLKEYVRNTDGYGRFVGRLAGIPLLRRVRNACR